MSIKLDLPISFCLSAALHGAAAVGIYGAVVVGPSIALSGGGKSSSSIEVSYIPSLPPQPEQAGVISTASAQMSSLKPAELRLKPMERSVLKQESHAIPARLQAAAVKAPTNGDTSNACANPTCSSGLAPGAGDGPTQGSSLRYSPKPPYPWAARRAGFEGSVELAISIDSLGKVSQASIVKSSGRNDCDSSALDTITREWQFEPARAHGAPIEWRENIVVVYSLRP
ncbi:MAG: TonB family protein [Oligoflexia bacterium]|nr:TonB family protein [Oligoflexia bacterium]